MLNKIYLGIAGLVITVSIAGSVYWHVNSLHNKIKSLQAENIQISIDRDTALKSIETKDKRIEELRQSMVLANELQARTAESERQAIKEYRALALKERNWNSLRKGNQKELVLSTLNKALDNTTKVITGVE